MRLSLLLIPTLLPFFLSPLRAQEKDFETSLFQGQTIDFSKPLTHIAFGSCNNQRKEREQRMWSSVARNRPDLWVWLGDNIYGDSEDMAVLRRKYLRQKNGQYYSALRKVCPVIGIWDDHDYGVNDGDKTYPKKRESQALMLDFLDVAQDHPSRSREGAYQSYTFGEGDRKVKVILLDARFFRDELRSNPSGETRYLPNPTGDILGEAQWAWLKEELTNSDAAIHLIGSGIQIIPEQHPYEKWANFPSARTRFFQLLARTGVRNPILISGDRHIAEVSALKIPTIAQTVYEITSSGMTHTWSNKEAEELNRYRLGPLVISRNFAVLKIDWEATPLRATIEIRGPENELLLEDKLFLR